MTDILSKIDDDIDEYLLLCKRYNETPEYKRDVSYIQYANAWGPHAKFLKKRYHNEHICNK